MNVAPIPPTGIELGRNLDKLELELELDENRAAKLPVGHVNSVPTSIAAPSSGRFGDGSAAGEEDDDELELLELDELEDDPNGTSSAPNFSVPSGDREIG
jgi:hypothetical protein